MWAFLIAVMLTARCAVGHGFLDLANVGCFRVIRHVEVHMRDRVGHVEEERSALPVLCFDEVEPLRREEIVAVVRALFGIVGEEHFLAVPRQKRRVVMVRVGLVEITEPVIEALLIRHACAALVTAAPFPDHAGGVARSLQHLGDGHILRQQRRLALALWAQMGAVVADATVPGVQSGQQRRARRRTHARTRIMLRELQPLCPHAVDARCLDDLPAVAAEIAVTEIVREDVNDVRFSLQ